MTNDFFVPDYDSVDAECNVCPPGRHDCTATRIYADTSKTSGRPMMVIEWTVDGGPGAGHKLVDYITFGLSGMIGEAKLKRICEWLCSRDAPEQDGLCDGGG